MFRVRFNDRDILVLLAIIASILAFAHHQSTRYQVCSDYRTFKDIKGVGTSSNYRGSGGYIDSILYLTNDDNLYESRTQYPLNKEVCVKYEYKRY
jgi:hypothetical protein